MFWVFTRRQEHWNQNFELVWNGTWLICEAGGGRCPLQHGRYTSIEVPLSDRNGSCIKNGVILSEKMRKRKENTVIIKILQANSEECDKYPENDIVSHCLLNWSRYLLQRNTYYRGLKFVTLGLKGLLILQSVHKMKLNLSSCFLANLTLVKQNIQKTSCICYILKPIIL